MDSGFRRNDEGASPRRSLPRTAIRGPGAQVVTPAEAGVQGFSHRRAEGAADAGRVLPDQKEKGAPFGRALHPSAARRRLAASAYAAAALSPAASRSAAALSVTSQVNSGSSRPKWPWVAVRV